MAGLSSKGPDPDRVERGETGGHVLAGSLAMAASVAVHALLAVAVSRVDMNYLTRSPYFRPDREFVPMQLGSVEISTDTQVKVLTALRELGQAQPPDVTRAVDEMQVAPEVGVTDPPAIADTAPGPEPMPVTAPPLAPMDESWQPRQEIMAVETMAVGDVIAGLERRVIPVIERVPDAPDVVLPVGYERAGMTVASPLPSLVPAQADALAQRVGVPAVLPPVEREVLATLPPAARERFEETPDDITDVEPVDHVLTAKVETFAGGRDRRYGYFRLTVERDEGQLLPVRPKDVLLVQDASASMSEQRLFFSREAMRRALAQVGPADRFNVVKFAERTTSCFPGWVTKTPDTLTQAEAFINAMTAEGGTDLFASMRELLAVERQPGRPVIAFLITDGLVNTGLTDSTEIIGTFTRQNQGRISVFTIGVLTQSNEYLLDLLSYCNNGAAEIVTTGRWDIPAVAERVMQGLQRPVLSGLAFRFASDADVEVYPQQIGNLYLDRPLVIYGRYRRDMSQLVFQAVGMAGTTRTDMIFNLPLELPRDIRAGGEGSIREVFGRQKVYHLIGEYTRTRDRAVLRELRQTGREYGQVIPYRDAIGL